jgi:hypothetical protein
MSRAWQYRTPVKQSRQPRSEIFVVTVRYNYYLDNDTLDVMALASLGLPCPKSVLYSL